jgi:hypothetical protein
VGELVAGWGSTLAQLVQFQVVRCVWLLTRHVLPSWVPAAPADDVHARDRTAAAAAAAAAAADVAVGRGRKRKRKQAEKQSKQQQKARKDEEFGVTRGIDFKGVRSIINFDIPDSVQVCYSCQFVVMRYVALSRGVQMRKQLLQVAGS